MNKFISNIQDAFEVIVEGVSVRMWIIGLVSIIFVVGMISPRYALDRFKNLLD